MLTADAFGVLPPISKLTAAQAMYHFLSGYTAQVAGTEKGMGSEPQATFSTCFGAPFLPRRPEVYGKMLAELIERTAPIAGWSTPAGPAAQYGVGKRMSIQHTRALLRAVLDGSLEDARFEPDPFFGLMIPQRRGRHPERGAGPAPGLGRQGGLRRKPPRTWSRRFEANFATFSAHVGDDVKAIALRAAA